MNQPGHPQCRRNDTIVGFPFSAGKTNCGQEGALSPAVGATEVSMYAGEYHDDSSLEMLILFACDVDMCRK
jgi:hypothetical protein